MPANRMSDLIDKIERRLGTKMLNLPDHLRKNTWAEVIDKDSLTTFSRFFPNSLRINIDVSQRRADGWYVIDKYVPDGIEIIGVRDIDWKFFANDSISQQHARGYGYEVLSGSFGMEDVALIQMRANLSSIFNNGTYIDYMPPNMVRITSVTGYDVTKYMNFYPLDVHIKHASNLMTIPATMMETFEGLAMADVAKFIYEELKYFEGLETVHANMDIKLSDLQDAASKREEIVQLLDESHVSAANANQPLMICQ